MSEISTAVATTFCKGNRRAKPIKVERVAKPRNSPSSDRSAGDVSIRRAPRTSSPTQQTRHSRNTGFCHGFKNCEGSSAPLVPPRDASEAGSAVFNSINGGQKNDLPNG